MSLSAFKKKSFLSFFKSSSADSLRQSIRSRPVSTDCDIPSRTASDVTVFKFVANRIAANMRIIAVEHPVAKEERKLRIFTLN